MSEKLPGFNEEVLLRIRGGCVSFVESESFVDFFRAIHPGLFDCLLFNAAGIFRKEARGMARNRARATPGLIAQYRRCAYSAPVVLARIVMANTMVLFEGESSPALVVVAFGEGAEEAMDVAATVLARVHFDRAENEAEKQLARSIEDETYRFGHRRKLPTWLVGNVEAYAADLWVPSQAAYEDGLTSSILPCLAEPGKNGLTMAIPTEIIQTAMGAIHGPPPLPKDQ